MDEEQQPDITYSYNADGIRIAKTVNGIKHEYILSGTQIDQEIIYNEWGTEVETELRYIYDAQGLPCAVRVITAYSNTYYLLETNIQGDVIAIYNTSGTKLVEYFYDAWGNILDTNVYTGGTDIATLNPFRYRGYYYDAETNWYYLNSRYYNPEWGRFINCDGYVSTGQGLIGYNMFAYCNNNPVNYTDYAGEDAIYLTDEDGAFGFGHTGLLIQDENGTWHHFYWGDKDVSLKKMEGFTYSSFDALNQYLIDNNIYRQLIVTHKRIFWFFFKKCIVYSAYESYIYMEGDFSKSYEYAKSLVGEYEMGAKKPKNQKYSLLNNNCMQVSKDVLNQSGTNINNERMLRIPHSPRIIIRWENIIPNISPYNIGGKRQ